MENKNYTLSEIQQKSVERLKSVSAHVIALSPWHIIFRPLNKIFM
jgi:hypothetical protein